MKRVATAMGNPTLNMELKRYAQMDVVGDDLFYQEAVIDFLEKESVDVLALSGILQGQWELPQWIEKIMQVAPTVRLVVVLDEMDATIKCNLIDQGVKDIFIDETVEVKDMIEAIEREEPIRMKLEKEAMTKQDNMDIKEKKLAFSVSQKQEVIAICGINGSGKSTITYQLSKNMIKKTDSKILVIDMNTLCGNIDELYGINKTPPNVEIPLDIDKKCGLNYAADLIKKGRFDANVLEEIVIEKNGVDILTGNTSLYYCQEVLNSSIYQSILQSAKEKYDFILLDTSSNLFLDATKWSIESASKVLFVMENDYLSLEKCKQMLEVMTKNWGVWKNKISLIINKERPGGVELEVLEKILEEYQMVGHIRQNGEQDHYAYEKILESIHFIPKISFLEKLNYWKSKAQHMIESNHKPSIQNVRRGLNHAH